MIKAKYTVRNHGDTSVGIFPSETTVELKFNDLDELSEEEDEMIKSFLTEFFDDCTRIQVLNEQDIENEEFGA